MQHMSHMVAVGTHPGIPMKFTKPVEINSADVTKLQPGQWVTADGAFGRFAGLTPAGTVLVSWSRGRAGMHFASLCKFRKARVIEAIRTAELAAYRAF